MLSQVITTSLSENNLPPESVDAIVFTSCSVPLIPSIDAAAAARVGLRPDISRVPIYQHGCAGGVVGLNLGNKFAQLGMTTLVCSVELCSLVFHPKCTDGPNLVGASIFADGAACAVIKPESNAIKIINSHSELLPDSRHLMGYDLSDQGFHLRLDRQLPKELLDHVPAIADKFLKQNGISFDQVKHWLFHPGGIKILNLLESRLEIPPAQAIWARDVLSKNGNMSSATIFFVIDEFIRSHQAKPGDNALIVGIGPGLTVELVLLQIA